MHQMVIHKGLQPWMQVWIHWLKVRLIKFSTLHVLCLTHRNTPCVFTWTPVLLLLMDTTSTSVAVKVWLPKVYSQATVWQGIGCVWLTDSTSKVHQMQARCMIFLTLCYAHHFLMPHSHTRYCHSALDCASVHLLFLNVLSKKNRNKIALYLWSERFFESKLVLMGSKLLLLVSALCFPQHHVVFCMTPGFRFELKHVIINEFTKSWHVLSALYLVDIGHPSDWFIGGIQQWLPLTSVFKICL